MHFETISPNPLSSAGRSPTLRTPLVLRWAACRALAAGVGRFRAPWAFWQKPCFGREGPCCIRAMPRHLPWHYPVNPVITSEDFSLCISGRNLGGKIHARSCSGSSAAEQLPACSTANPSKVWLHPDPPFPRNSPLQELVSLGLPIPPGGYFTSKPTPRQGRAPHPSSAPHPRSNTGHIMAGAAAVGQLCSLRFVSLMSPSEGGARVAAGCCQGVGAAQSPAATQEELEQGLELPGICRQIPTAISPDKPVLLVACKLPWVLPKTVEAHTAPGRDLAICSPS